MSLQYKQAVGIIVPYTGLDEPNGWLTCDGRAVSRTRYTKLFARISDQFGAGDGSTTFNLPDLRGLTIMGVNHLSTPNGQSADINLSARAYKDIGGEEFHQLTIPEMPIHDHTGTTDPHTDNHTHTISGPASTQPDDNDDPGGVTTTTSQVTSTNGIHDHDLENVNNTGDNQPHNNMQPFLVAQYLIKY